MAGKIYSPGSSIFRSPLNTFKLISAGTVTLPDLTLTPYEDTTVGQIHINLTADALYRKRADDYWRRNMNWPRLK